MPCGGVVVLRVAVEGEEYVPRSHKISEEAVRLANELVRETKGEARAKASRLLYLITGPDGRARL